MEKNHFLGVDLKQFVAQNRENSLYYQPIPRTGDLLKDIPLFANGGNKIQPDFFIAPSRIKVGRLASKALNQLKADLRLESLPSDNDIVQLEIHELLSQYGGEGYKRKNILKEDLMQRGLTGELIHAARNLNQARLNPADREMFSRPEILMYTFYRAVVGLNVHDVEGIVSNVHASLLKVRCHLNRQLVDLVLDEQNLETNEEERELLREKFAKRHLSYLEGKPTKAILHEYRQLKQGGDLFQLVEDFLNSGLVKLPDHVDREALIDHMVNFLIQNGFRLTDNAASIFTPEYMVEGTVVNAKGNPIAGIRVKAWDKDRFGKKDLLGNETLTDSKGYYRISYQVKDFMKNRREPGDAPDIQVHLHDTKGKVICKSKHYKDAPKHLLVDIKLEAVDDFSDILFGIPELVEQLLYAKDIRTYKELAKVDNSVLSSMALAADLDPEYPEKMQWKKQATLASRREKSKLNELIESLIKLI